MNYNRIVLIGRLTKDFEKKGDKWGKLSLAVNHEGEEKEVSYFDLLVMGDKRVEFFNNALKKGMLVLADGEMKSKKVGDKVYWQVTVSSLKILESKKSVGKEAESKENSEYFVEEDSKFFP